ncbi:MAG: hypothetical protein LIP01_16100 [Tannerellaceae bacterium]|nr:hypothetical protein [Tannerellaceae bacterium]
MGEGVSKGLNNTETNTDMLRKYNLPVFVSLKELAGQMGHDLNSLRYLLYNRKVARTSHYYTFEIPKKQVENALSPHLKRN